jgi:Protein tyrosine and serine/threonine kinase
LSSSENARSVLLGGEFWEFLLRCTVVLDAATRQFAIELLNVLLSQRLCILSEEQQEEVVLTALNALSVVSSNRTVAFLLNILQQVASSVRDHDLFASASSIACLVALITEKDASAQDCKRAAILLSRLSSVREDYKLLIIKKGGVPFLRCVLDFGLDIQFHRSVLRDDVELDCVVGRGAVGEVWKGHWQGQLVAVKKFQASAFSFNEHEFKLESSFMSVLQHPRLVSAIGVCAEGPEPFILAKFYENGTMGDVILKHKRKLDEKAQLQLATDVAEGLAYLHSANILHRDVKPDNVLIDGNMRAAVADFGIMRFAEAEGLLACWE